MKIKEDKIIKNTAINQIAFGRKIRDAREKLGIPRSKLAEQVDISTNFLGDIERGVKLPSLPTLVLMVNVLKISIDSLLCDSLNNVVEEECDNMYYSDRQKAIINSVIKTVIENFKD